MIVAEDDERQDRCIVSRHSIRLFDRLRDAKEDEGFDDDDDDDDEGDDVDGVNVDNGQASTLSQHLRWTPSCSVLAAYGGC